MEQIITLKVDLEYPDEAHHAIDEAAKAYETDELKWTAEELAEAKHLAMQIMTQLCLNGYSISWQCGNHSVYLLISDDARQKIFDISYANKENLWDVWVAKCFCLCCATGREAPAFIIKKAGECW